MKGCCGTIAHGSMQWSKKIIKIMFVVVCCKMQGVPKGGFFKKKGVGKKEVGVVERIFIDSQCMQC